MISPSGPPSLLRQGIDVTLAIRDALRPASCQLHESSFRGLRWFAHSDDTAINFKGITLNAVSGNLQGYASTTGDSLLQPG